MGCVINREWMMALFNKIRKVIHEDVVLDVTTRVALPYRQEGFNDPVSVFRITTYQRRWFWMDRLIMQNQRNYHKVEVISCNSDQLIRSLIVHCGRSVDGALQTYFKTLYLQRCK